MTEEDQYNSTVGSNWWDLPSSSSSRSSTASSTTSSSSSAVSASGGYVAGSSGWVQLHASTTDNTGGVVVGHRTDDINNTAGSGSSTVAADYPNFMGCWNQQDLLLSEKGGGGIGSFRSMLQEGMGMGTSSSTTNYQQQQQETDGSMLFTSTNLQGCCLFESNQQQQQTPPSSSLFNYGSFHPNNSTDDPQQQGNYGLLPCNNESLIDSSNWSGDNNNNNNKLPAAAEFLRHSSPAGDSNKPNQQNCPFWSNMGDGERQPVGLFFPPLIQNKTATTIPAAAFEEKPKIHAREIQISASAGTQKSSSASSSTVTSNTKRSSRSEGSSAMPPFKVRKEKMGDRITALQQLVSPFGKTDTASVLSEAIEYIKFLHEQVGLLTTPYLKTGSSLQHQQQQIMTSSCDKPSSNVPEEDHHLRRQDLRSRGLCLVPVSSTFPVAHETSVDFWTPTFGATFR